MPLGTARVAARRRKPSYSPNAVVADGTNDFMTHASGVFSGAADSKLLTIACTFKLNAINIEQRIISDSIGGFATTRLRILSTNVLQLELQDVPSAIICDIRSSITLTTGVQYNVLISVDMADTAKRHLLINDVDRLAVTTYTNAVADLTGDSLAIGASATSTEKLNGEIADLWIDYGRYVDFSVEANRRKFFSSVNCLVNKGTDGSVPFGTAPIGFFSGATASWHTNKGSGGGMTLTGALGTSSSPPCGV